MTRRLIALDLDGTLLPRSKVLTARSRAAVSAVREAGHEVVLATGKTFHLAAAYAAELGLAGPVIALDGALVRDHPSGDVSLARTVPSAAARESLELVAGLELLPFIADEADRLVAHPGLESWRWFLGVYSERIDIADSPGDAFFGDPYFLAFLGPHDAVLRGEGALSGNGLQTFTAAFPQRGVSLLLLRPRTDKGAALRHVAERMEVARERVVAVGDWRNDVQMIEWAGTGVAMGDADPEALAVADVVLPGDSEEDAVAAWLEELATSR